MANVCELRHAQPSKAALWEWRCPRRHVLRVVRGEEESTLWVSCPKSQPPIFGSLYACDTNSVASEGFQNLVTCQKITPSRVALLDSLAISGTDRVGECDSGMIDRG